MKIELINIMLVAMLCGCNTSEPHQVHAPAPESARPTPVLEREYDGETIDILFTGHDVKSGVYRFRPDELCTLMHLLFRMGGVSPYVDLRDVRVIRHKPDGKIEEFKVNAEELLETGEPEKDVPLKHGDRVVIQPKLLAI